MPGVHALLAPSHGEIWFKCTPAPRAGEGITPLESPYAEEGTLAHELSELLLNRQLKRIREQEYKIKFTLLKESKFYSTGMLKYVQAYVSYVMALYAKALLIDEHALIFIEKTVILTRYIPKGFGKADVFIVARDWIWFVDLKYGQGVKVEAKDNIQLKIYGLGVLIFAGLFTTTKNLSLTIYQPRLQNIDTFEIAAEELQEWGEKTLKPIAEKAWAGKGEYVPGEHCRFCAVKPTCKALKKKALEVFTEKPPSVLTAEDIAHTLKWADPIINYLSSVKEHALKEALKGTVFPGFKLIESRSNRFVKDVKKALKILKEAGYNEEEILEPVKLKGIGDLENLLGQEDFNYYLKDVIEKPPGAPALVPEEKKGKPYDKLSRARKAFAS